MTDFTNATDRPLVPGDPQFAERIAESFARQTFMDTIGAELVRLEPGAVDIALQHSGTLLQQHGYIHAGALITVADSAAGYAAMTLVPPGGGVLTAELKVNLLNPARSGPYVAEGRVLKPGRKLIICRADVFAGDSRDTHLLTGLLTMMQVEGVDE